MPGRIPSADSLYNEYVLKQFKTKAIPDWISEWIFGRISKGFSKETHDIGSMEDFLTELLMKIVVGLLKTYFKKIFWKSTWTILQGIAERFS